MYDKPSLVDETKAINKIYLLFMQLVHRILGTPYKLSTQSSLGEELGTLITKSVSIFVMMLKIILGERLLLMMGFMMLILSFKLYQAKRWQSKTVQSEVRLMILVVNTVTARLTGDLVVRVT